MAYSFRDLTPGAEPWLQRLADTSLVQQAKQTGWAFATIEAAHLLFLAVLGGAVLAPALRLLGLALTEVPSVEVERRTRPWLHAGVAGAVASGVAMGVMNSSTLYPSVAFFVKMVALIAAILFSYAVVRQVVRSGEGASRSSVAATVAAVGIWGVALFVFVTTPRVNPGAVLIVAAGVALLFAAARRHRTLLVLGLAGLLAAGWAVTHLLLQPGDPRAAGANIGFVAAAAVFALAVGLLEIRGDASRREAPAKLAAFASLLAWVTVAAAGRWIGFS